MAEEKAFTHWNRDMHGENGMYLPYGFFMSIPCVCGCAVDFNAPGNVVVCKCGREYEAEIRLMKRTPIHG